LLGGLILGAEALSEVLASSLAIEMDKDDPDDPLRHTATPQIRKLKGRSW
jgi:hypothetical protein